MRALLTVLLVTLTATAVAQPPPAQVHPGDLEDRGRRLNGLISARIVWMKTTCGLTAKQRKELTVAAEAAVKRVQNGPLIVNAPGGIRKDFGPFYFAAHGCGRALLEDKTWQQTVNASLDESQRELLARALREREQFQSEGRLGIPLFLLDRELIFTPEQRDQMRRVLRSHPRDTVLRSRFCFRESGHQRNRVYFHEWVPERRFVQVQNFLHEVQLRRWSQISQADRTPAGDPYVRDCQVLIQTAMAQSRWEEYAAKSTRLQRERLLDCVDMRIAFLRSEAGLTDAQLTRLHVAGKGAVTRIVDEWTERVGQVRADYIRRSNGINRLVAVAVPPTSGIDTSRRWAATYSATSSPQLVAATKQRADAHRRLHIDAVLAFFDQELWLRPNQRESVRKLLERTYVSPTWLGKRHVEATLVAMAVFSMKQEALDPILNAPQRRAWRAYRGMFERLGTRARYIAPEGAQALFRIAEGDRWTND